MINEIPQLRTVGVIAVQLDIPVDRAKQLLRKFGIRPVGALGCMYVYSREAVEVFPTHCNSDPF